jgi:hypothetical protein
MRTKASALTLTGDGIEFALSVVGYQFPDATDYWDGNWLVI